jgi:hypothetical protein
MGPPLFFETLLEVTISWMRKRKANSLLNSEKRNER